MRTDVSVHNERMEAMSKLLVEEFYNWSRRTGGIQSQSDFARWLGVSDASLSNWISKKRLPAGGNLVQLNRKLGNEVNRIMGFPYLMPSNPDLEWIVDNWHCLDEQGQQEVIGIIADKCNVSIPDPVNS